jgi:hypothetical protein
MERHLKPLTLATICLLALSCLSAKAQLTVYGKLDFNRYNSNNGDNDAVNLYGGGVGIQDNFLHVGPLSLGADLRGDLDSGSQNTYYSLLFGAPVSFKLHTVKPYLEPVVGVGGVKYTGPTAAGITTHYSGELTFGGVGGVVATVLPHLDWRVVEVGYISERGGTPDLLVSTGLGFRF